MTGAAHPSERLALNSADAERLSPTHLLALNASEGQVPEWINVIPAGIGVRGIDGRAWTMSDANSVIETFERRGNRLPVDVEHATQIKRLTGDPAPAVGYVVGLESRDTGLWARIDWNSAGEKILKDRSYAHCSPVFAYNEALEIKRLVSVGLTNDPNLDLVALNHAITTKKESPAMSKVAEALGLNSDASEASMVGAINDLKEREKTALNRAETPDLTKFAPRDELTTAQNKVAEYERADKDRAKAEVTQAVDDAVAAGKIRPSDKDFYIAACQNAGGLDAFRDLVKDAPEQVGRAGSREKTALNKAGTSGLSPDQIVAKARAFQHSSAEKGVAVNWADAVTAVSEGKA